MCGLAHARENRVGDDEAIAALASHQHGVVGRRQLVDLGVSGRSIDYRLRAGRLQSLFPGVYAVGHDAVSFAASALAAVMHFSPGAVASHETAAALWRLTEPLPGVRHVTAKQHRVSRPGTAIHRSRVDPVDVNEVDGIPVTSIPRTILDLAVTLPAHRTQRLIRDAEYRRMLTADQLVGVLERHPRRRGRRRLAGIVGLHASGRGKTLSPLEDLFLIFCRRRRIPMPETNVEVEARGRRYVADCLWRDARLIVELDGRDAHARELAFHADRARDRALIATGWVPMRITDPQLTHDADRIEAEIRSAIALRTADPAIRVGSTTR